MTRRIGTWPHIITDHILIIALPFCPPKKNENCHQDPQKGTGTHHPSRHPLVQQPLQLPSPWLQALPGSAPPSSTTSARGLPRRTRRSAAAPPSERLRAAKTTRRGGATRDLGWTRCGGGSSEAQEMVSPPIADRSHDRLPTRWGRLLFDLFGSSVSFRTPDPLTH